MRAALSFAGSVTLSGQWYRKKQSAKCEARSPHCRVKDVHEKQLTRRKSRRKSGSDIERSRQLRGRGNERRKVCAAWGGEVIAETAEYEFLDGKFYFPDDCVRWELLKESGKTKFLNPVGLAVLYDVVIGRGKRDIRCKGGGARFGKLKRPWEVMSGFTSFSKGVKVFSKADREIKIEEGEGERNVVDSGSGNIIVV